MWDTAGQESYRSLLPLYYRGASIVVLVYDITNEDSLEQTKWWGWVVTKIHSPSNINAIADTNTNENTRHLCTRRWLNQVRKECEPDVTIALVGNKLDLAAEHRKVLCDATAAPHFAWTHNAD